ncbi:MAG: hypothetical protein HYX83_03410 [Chloroflexi bacterium]|nr:hypothetical protein [Chloroflexota bacterium]
MKGGNMLFHITQTHTPETCPRDAGGSSTLYDAKAKGVKLIAMYGAFAEHVIYYIVEANDIAAVDAFVAPGWNRCTCRVTPVSSQPLIKAGSRQRAS